MNVIHPNEPPDAPDWSPVLREWDAEKCSPAECAVCEIPANIVLSDN